MLLGETAAGVTGADSLAAEVARQPGVEGVAPFTYAKAMVFHEGFTEGAHRQGRGPAGGARRDQRGAQHPRRRSTRSRSRTAGGCPGIVLGSELAARLAARVGDRVRAGDR